MRKFFYLPSCKTCQRVMRQIDPEETIDRQDIKTEPMTKEQLDAMRERAGSYEALFTRRSRQYRARGLHEKTLGEADYRDLILDHYTFLKRPVLVWDDEIFIGSAKNNVQAAAEAVGKSA